MSGLELSTRMRKFWPSQLIKDGVLNFRLIWLGLLGVLLIVLGGLFDSQPNRTSMPIAPETAKSQPPAAGRSQEEIWEAKLANLLSQVKGAGSVAVHITLETGSSVEHAKNVVRETKTVQEKDNNGGVRTTTEAKETEQVLLSRDSGTERPVMVREIKPAIKGVLVIAEGAADSTVKAQLTRAVEAGMGIPSYKITVLPQRK